MSWCTVPGRVHGTGFAVPRVRLRPGCARRWRRTSGTAWPARWPPPRFAAPLQDDGGEWAPGPWRRGGRSSSRAERPGADHAGARNTCSVLHRRGEQGPIGLEIPRRLMSLLSFHNPKAVVRGLDVGFFVGFGVPRPGDRTATSTWFRFGSDHGRHRAPCSRCSPWSSGGARRRGTVAETDAASYQLLVVAGCSTTSR